MANDKPKPVKAAAKLAAQIKRDGGVDSTQAKVAQAIKARQTREGTR